MYCARSELLRGMVALTLLGALSALSACASPRWKAPDGFLELDAPRGELKATDPKDARFWTRSFDDENGGDLEFWTEAIVHDFHVNRGYEDIRTNSIKDAAGRTGTLLECRVFLDGSHKRYLFALFVEASGSESRLHVAEFLVENDEYRKHRERILKTLQKG